MSIYLTIDGSEPAFLSSNQGYGDFCRWVDTLDDADAVKHLCEYGWYEPLEDVAKETVKALKNSPPDKNTQRVAESLLELTRTGEVVTITDGLSPVKSA